MLIHWKAARCSQKIISQFVLFVVFFSEVGGSTLDSHHGFIVEYGNNRDVDLGKCFVYWLLLWHSYVCSLNIVVPILVESSCFVVSYRSGEQLDQWTLNNAQIPSHCLTAYLVKHGSWILNFVFGKYM